MELVYIISFQDMSCLDLKTHSVTGLKVQILQISNRCMEDFRTNIAFFFAKSGDPKMEDFRTNIDVFFAKSGDPKILGISLDDAFTRKLLIKCYYITFTLLDHIPFYVFLLNLSILYHSKTCHVLI